MSNVGPYYLPQEKGGKLCYGSSSGLWVHHYAVIIINFHDDDHFVVDELYPDGLPLTDYKRLFREWDCLDFLVRTAPGKSQNEYPV
jgi:hypothetical protein